MNNPSVAQKFISLYARARREYGVKIYTKDTAWIVLWKVIDFILKIISFGKNNKFLTHYTTTIGNRIFYPVGWTFDRIDKKDYAILRHELVHVKQYHSGGLGSFKLGVITMGILYIAVFLPIGLAWFRYYFERNAYLESIKAYKDVGITVKADRYVEYLTGSTYIWAWPFKKRVRKWFDVRC